MVEKGGVQVSLTDTRERLTEIEARKLRSWIEALPDIPEGLHLSDDEIVGYASAMLSPAAREQCDIHLAACTECAEAMEFLLEEDAKLEAEQRMEALIAEAVSMRKRGKSALAWTNLLKVLLASSDRHVRRSCLEVVRLKCEEGSFEVARSMYRLLLDDPFLDEADKTTCRNGLAWLESTAGKAPSSEDVLETLAQFNRRAALELGARHASTHFYFEDKTKEALVAPGRTSCGCITCEPLVSPLKESGRFTVRLFRELLPDLKAGSRAAVYTEGSFQEKRDFSRTLYGERFECLLAALIEDKGKPIGVVKLENKLSEASSFDESARQALLRLIREFTPRLRRAYRWIQKRDWREVQFVIPPANS